MRAITYELDLKDDRTVTLTLPKDVPLGKRQIIIVIDDHTPEQVVTPETYEALLLKTSGLWKQEDGLRYQERLRDEWNRGS
jgi:hypothetical protein